MSAASGLLPPGVNGAFRSFVLAVNRLVGQLYQFQVIVIFHGLIVFGALAGLWMRPHRSYVYLVVLWMGVLWINAFFADYFPRYFLHFLPFSGMFLYHAAEFVWCVVLRRKKFIGHDIAPVSLQP